MSKYKIGATVTKSSDNSVSFYIESELGQTEAIVTITKSHETKYCIDLSKKLEAAIRRVVNK